MSFCAGNDPIFWNALEVVNSKDAAEKFAQLYRQARLASFWNRLTSHTRKLLSITEVSTASNRITHIDRGIQEISVRSIVGSVNRTGDYDGQFRPLNLALRERWVNAHVQTEGCGWEPITVWKAGDIYFVEDGHHRVSIARHSGWDTIEAHVYETMG